jgi:hypothetical protein
LGASADNKPNGWRMMAFERVQDAPVHRLRYRRVICACDRKIIEGQRNRTLPALARKRGNNCDKQ